MSLHCIHIRTETPNHSLCLYQDCNSHGYKSLYLYTETPTDTICATSAQPVVCNDGPRTLTMQWKQASCTLQELNE